MKPLILIALLTPLALAACKEEQVQAPDPVDLTEVALSYFCQMNVSEHGGPKGQIHLEGYPAPIFFAQVRDLVAYVKSPERDADITAIYVSDMSVAPTWQNPGISNWIAADGATFVVGSNVAGGMGAPEIVPFGDAKGAGEFISRYGGNAVPLTDIPDDAALGPVDLDLALETPA
ncbi:nitrous oxide reductase accessory protein NosL [Rhodobacteraceae bacterium M382]|nr:nitrous oxide reductase accessory protein NosL [Rhodobacteraceae bacterium M382]